MKLLGFEIKRAVKAAGPSVPGILPPFGTNEPMSRPVTNESSDLTERFISADPREGWYLSLPSKLTPNQVEMIKRAAIGGDIWQMHQLGELMKDTWPMLRKCDHELREAVSNVKFVVTPYAEDGQKPTKSAVKKADSVRRAITQMRPNPFNDEQAFEGMIYQMAGAFVNGIIVHELLWDKSPVRVPGGGYNRYVKSAVYVHPRHFSFANDGGLTLFDDSYNRMTWANANPRQSPNPDKFICGTFYNTSGSALSAGHIRALGWYYSALVFGREWMLNAAKQWGNPFLSISFRQNTDLTQLKAFLAESGPSRRLLHPEGTLPTIHPAQSMGTDNPQRFLAEEADRQCQLLILGQTLSSNTSSSGGGAYALGQVHMEVRADRVQGVAQWLSGEPLCQLSKAICRVNFGDDQEYPRIAPDFTKPLAPGEVGALASAISGSKTPVKLEEHYRKLGYTAPEPGDIVIVNGEIKIQGEPMTDEERQESQLLEQEKLMEMQSQFQEPEAPPTNAKDTAPIDLQKCSDAELAELEEMVQAAERAPHKNGELTALNEKLLTLNHR